MSPDQIRSHRLARGWTQRQLGERMGLAASGAAAKVSRLETGAENVTALWCARLVAAFASGEAMPERAARKAVERTRVW